MGTVLAKFDDHALLAVAQEAAGEAADALRRMRSQWSGVEQVIGREVKVHADREAEAIVVAALQRAGPIPILSEETGWIGAGASEAHDLTWAVDPLDGSVNYIKGFPHCAVSIALLRGGRPVLGIVDCFLLGETFAGLVGAGAWMNGAPISVSTVTRREEGILNTGIPARAKTDADSFNAFMNDMLKWRKVRMLGSAAAALAYVAAGRADFYRESGSMIWDVAAGLALVEAAGGRVKMEGESADQPLIVAASNAGLSALL
jgi:myo-inositol-1(or 4)-monophosphatase